MALTTFFWTAAIAGYLANEAFRLLETGSRAIAAASTLVALTALYLGPVLFAVLGLFMVRRIRGSEHG